ncbi:MAG: hypothetical protein US30_C0002G0019 [Candidatus Moranbacteria bacterium GW2011_GWF2_36_839]|nr:MAG: hypothetical protein US27_C0003G0019 [Candidatus Moranbacteria bacterium GW2011_GWF1_36_78]KKQ17559.1 MAG: hypothetical protein US30_C0002G0019 [Candidatus Moranbacteria bacterium GW2011_GWF2_36_839]HAT74283.1 hypothetical protein [Candidatus Moranbacteria bacterium]HBY10938.1 hypothetical protein [Candidatus Moranbacteria bacterium]
MIKIKVIKIFFSFFILFSPFYTVAAVPGSGVEFINKMHDCAAEEANKCLDLEHKCKVSCPSSEGGYVKGGCLEGCALKEDECWDYSQRVLAKYEECDNKQGAFLFGNNKISNEKDFCTAKIAFADCMEDFSGLCKMPWPRDCNNANSQTQNKNSKNQDNSKGNENSNNELIGLPVDSKISTVPCIGEMPKNSELCPKDDEKVFYYTKKELVESCSVPEGNEPKCEYVCKGGYNLVDGECERVGFFARIMNWLGGLF